MPALPVSLMEPLWAQFAALLPVHPEVDPTHPLGCHRRRIPDRVVFEHVVEALVHGSGYERIASPGCSERTIRRRVRAWAEAGLMPQLHALVLAQYDHLVGLDLRHVCVDGGITKAPGGGAVAGRSPVDRGKQGRKRSLTRLLNEWKSGASEAYPFLPEVTSILRSYQENLKLGPAAAGILNPATAVADTVSPASASTVWRSPPG